MNRREASKQETRSLIMEAAKKLFTETDLDKCTMRAIAKRAGVSPASVVVHFKNKIALMEAVLTEDIDRNVENAIATIPEEGDFAERITHIWRSMYRFYSSNRELYRFFVSRTVFEPDEETPSIASQMVTFFNYIAQLIDFEKQEGRMASEVDSGIMTEMLFMQYFGVLVMFFRDVSMSPEAAADHVLSITRLILASHTQQPIH